MAYAREWRWDGLTAWAKVATLDVECSLGKSASDKVVSEEAHRREVVALEEERTLEVVEGGRTFPTFDPLPWTCVPPTIHHWFRLKHLVVQRPPRHTALVTKSLTVKSSFSLSRSILVTSVACESDKNFKGLFHSL